MTIECPNCQARYEVQLPPEGRNVRCARCKQVWRAMPQEEAADATEEVGWHNHESSHANGKHEDEPAGQSANGHDLEQGASLTSNGHGGEDLNEGAGMTRQQATETFDTVQPYSQASPGHAPRGADQAGPSSSPPTAASGHDHWDRTPRVNDGQSHVIPFRSAPSAFHNDFEMAAPANELQTLEEARAAVRDVFSSLNDPARPVNSNAYVEPVLTPSGDAAFARSRFSVLPSGTAGQHGHTDDSDERDLYRHSVADSEPAGQAEDNPELESSGEENAGSEDATERTVDDEDIYSESESSAAESSEGPYSDSQEFNAAVENAPIRQAGSQALSDEEADAAIRAALTRHYARDNLEPVPTQDFELAQQLEAQLKSKLPPREEGESRFADLQNRPTLPLDNFTFGEFNRDDREDAAEADGQTRIDEGLLQQLEKTKTQAVEGRRRGGLLLAAAWGLFLSIAAGLIGGALAFRDMAAEALPGLAPVYRSLGMPVTVQPLSFDNVRYEWSATASRPTLVISGTVVNKANRKVKTPDFYLTVKDQDPQLDREYSIALPVEGAKIRAKQQADFQIELVAPNPSLTAVELELRNVQ